MLSMNDESNSGRTGIYMTDVNHPIQQRLDEQQRQRNINQQFRERIQAHNEPLNPAPLPTMQPRMQFSAHVTVPTRQANPQWYADDIQRFVQLDAFFRARDHITPSLREIARSAFLFHRESDHAGSENEFIYLNPYMHQQVPELLAEIFNDLFGLPYPVGATNTSSALVMTMAGLGPRIINQFVPMGQQSVWVMHTKSVNDKVVSHQPSHNLLETINQRAAAKDVQTPFANTMRDALCRASVAATPQPESVEQPADDSAHAASDTAAQSNTTSSENTMNENTTTAESTPVNKTAAIVLKIVMIITTVIALVIGAFVFFKPEALAELKTYFGLGWAWTTSTAKTAWAATSSFFTKGVEWVKGIVAKKPAVEITEDVSPVVPAGI